MRRTILASLFALATVLVGAEARAGEWGLHSGDTMGGGDVLLYGEFGWPDISAGLQYGMSSRADIGVRASLLYGYEYTTATAIGMGVRVPIRIALVKRPRVSAFFHVDPGFKFYSNPGYCGGYFYCGPYNYYYRDTLFALQVPLGVEFGIYLTPDATLQFGVDVPIDVLLYDRALVLAAPQVGVGFEYHVDQHFGIGFNTRFGPSFFVQNGSASTFGFVAQLGLMYRI